MNRAIKDEIFIKHTGTTEGFEHYYGEVIINGKFITSYYVKPRRGAPNLFVSRKHFRNYQAASIAYGDRVTAPNEELFKKRILEAIEVGRNE